MSDQRTEREILAEAYSDEAKATWRAPVQKNGGETIPWPLHLEAYKAYCAKWSPQVALVDLKGRGCRGGFSAGELDDFVPGWRDRVSYIGRLEARVKELEAAAPSADKLRIAVEALEVISRASARSETMFGGKMSEVTRVFQNITRVSDQALAALKAEGAK